MFQEKLKFSVFKSTFYSISSVSNFKSNTTMTINTNRSRTVTLIAPTIDISPQKAILSTQQCRQNVIKITRKPCYRKDDRAMRPYMLFTLILFTLTATVLCVNFERI